MGLTESSATGRTTTQTSDAQTGLLLQDAASQTIETDVTTTTIVPTTVGSVDTYAVNVQFATPFLIIMGISYGDDGGNDQVHKIRVFGTSGSPFKFRVVDYWLHNVDNDDTSATAELAHYTLDVDGALDTETTMTAVEAISTNDEDLDAFGRTPGTSQLVEAAAVVDEGEEVVCEVNTAGTGGSEFTLKIMCVPTI
jgi:hypothetical protein